MDAISRSIYKEAARIMKEEPRYSTYDAITIASKIVPFYKRRKVREKALFTLSIIKYEYKISFPTSLATITFFEELSNGRILPMEKLLEMGRPPVKNDAVTGSIYGYDTRTLNAGDVVAVLFSYNSPFVWGNAISQYPEGFSMKGYGMVTAIEQGLPIIRPATPEEIKAHEAHITVEEEARKAAHKQLTQWVIEQSRIKRIRNHSDQLIIDYEPTNRWSKSELPLEIQELTRLLKQRYRTILVWASSSTLS